MIDPTLLARIRKVLALSASANEHEAAAALAAARRLMDENGVSDADLAMAGIEERAARGTRTLRPPLWEQMLCLSVRRALSVSVFVDEAGDRRYIGHGPTAEIAAYAFVTLFRTLKATRSAYIKRQLRRCSPARKRLRADAFCEGWAAAVLTKIAAIAPDRGPDPAIETYLATYHPGLVTIERRAGASVRLRTPDFVNGAVRGGEVNLHHGMSGDAAAPALIGTAHD